MNSPPKVTILLATYQGQKYLHEQLDSLINQTYSNIGIWASDDGSTDNTYSILQNHKNKFGEKNFIILRGPQKGFAFNFLSLLCNTDLHSEFYAYSDQDDIWGKDKIRRAVDWLTAMPPHIPLLYCSRTQLVDANNNHISFSPLFTRKPSFANALVQNIGGGNTMVFNHAARQLLREVTNLHKVVSHDWLTYMVILGTGGKVFYDSYPSLRYRQHENNLVGMNSRWSDRLTRIKMLFAGRFKISNNENIKALKSIQDKLTPQNKQILNQFQFVQNSNLIYRLIHFKKTGIYRQTRLGNIGLFIAILFKKI